jgi:chorismate mutase-like protein
MNLDELRKEIDTIDEQIVALINERCTVAAKVGEWKKKQSHAIYVPEREKQLFERLHAKNNGPISSSALRSIYREIISGAIALEKPLNILFFDSHENSSNAARETFGDAAEYSSCSSITKLMEALHSDKYDYGVVPLADSSGNFSETVLLELIKYKEIKICAERIGSINDTEGRYFIIGMQETTPTSEDRTAIAIELSNASNDWLDQIKNILKDKETFTAIEIDNEKTGQQTIFIEFAGHPTDDNIKTILNTISEKVGKMQIQGGFPVLYA